MADVVFPILLVASFAVLVGLVRLCDRIVRSGSDELPPSTDVEAGDGH